MKTTLKKNERIAMKSVDLPEEIIEMIRHVRMDPKYNYLNELLETDTPEYTRLLQKEKDWPK